MENPEITAIIKANVRVPETAMGDMRAQLASIRTGERRVMHLLKRYGNQAFNDSIQLIYEQSEKLARAAVRQIPDGVYQAESFMDDDGVNLGKNLLRSKSASKSKTIRMTIDLSNVSPEVAGFYNSGVTAGLSAAEVVFKCITTPLLLADQRRLVSAVENHPSARPSHQRGQAGAGAGVDDRTDDRVRHAFPRACSRLSGAYHRRPLRRSVYGQSARLRRRKRDGFSGLAHRTSRRRLGRET